MDRDTGETPGSAVARAAATPPAVDLLAMLVDKHGPLLLHQSGGCGAGFSLEAPEGFRFLTRSRLFTDEEVDQLEAAGPAPRGEWSPV